MENLTCVLEIYVILFKGGHPCKSIPLHLHNCLLKGPGDGTLIGLLHVLPKTLPWVIKSHSTAQHNHISHNAMCIKCSCCEMFWFWNATFSVGHKSPNIMFIHLLRHYWNDLAVENVAITATHHMSHYFQPVAMARSETSDFSTRKYSHCLCRSSKVKTSPCHSLFLCGTNTLRYRLSRSP